MEGLAAAGWGVNRRSRAITEQQNLIEVVGALLPSWQNREGPERGAQVGGRGERDKTGKQEKVERARADTSV